MPLFKLKLHVTYYKAGFFNVPVDFDRFVRGDNGPVDLMIGTSGRRIKGTVNRNANRNGTARILGGTALRNWLQSNYEPNDIVDVDFISPTSIQLG